MRSSYPLEIEYVKLIRNPNKNIWINHRHYYTLGWLENYSMLTGYYTGYYKRYCYA